MDRLSEELVLEILSRLPIPSLVQSKSVCRLWRILIRGQELVNKHFLRMVDENDPSFIFQSEHPIQNQLYFGGFSSDQDDGNVMMITKKLPMPPLLSCHLVSSCNGLLCLRATHQSFGTLCFYNPFTRDFIELPKLIKHPSHVGVLGFGVDPTIKKYKVVEITYERATLPGYVIRSAMLRAQIAASSSIESAVHVLTVDGSPTWRNLGSFSFHFKWQKSQVLVNGKLHWISYPKRNEATNNLIISFDLATEQFQEVPMPDCISSDRQFHQLVVLRGCLSAASFNDDTEQLEIWVMKDYDVKESWVQEFSIGTFVPNECETLNNSRFYLPEKCIRIICLLRSGRILLEYRNKALVLYDPHCRTFKDLQVTFEGTPKCFMVDVQVATLNWIDTLVNT